MPTGLSIYLDALRIFAALWVAVAHLGVWGVVGPEISQWLPASGHDAVIIFFVLSGFVITHAATNQKGPGQRTFAVGRLSRMYSTAAPILLLTVAVDLWGLSVNPDVYENQYVYDKLWVYVPLHLGFFGEFWFLSEQAFTISPYWSLSYEFWYYVLFGALLFHRGWRRWLFVGLLLAFVGYKLWLLWPVWLAGAWLYRFGDRARLTKWPARALAAGSLLTYLYIQQTGLPLALQEFGCSLFGDSGAATLDSAKSYLADYLTCALVLLHIHGVRHADLRFGAGLTRWVRWSASYTFTLYLAHGLVEKTIGYHLEYDRNSVLNAALILAAVLVSTLLIGELTERRRRFYRKPIGWIVDTVVRMVRYSPRLRNLLRPAQPTREIGSRYT